MVPIVLVCGVQGSGKSWVCRQLTGLFSYVAHDRCWSHPSVPSPPADAIDPAWGPPGSKSTHFETLFNEARLSPLPVLTEVPFGERELRRRLEMAGVHVIPVFIVEKEDKIAAQYLKREGRELPGGVLTRNRGLVARARDWGAFCGSSEAVSGHLRALFSFMKAKQSRGRRL
jgi:hypothetical protein